MIYTFNGCSRSNITISPKNWKAGASLKKSWRIFYRFYDPAFKDDPKFKRGKPISIRGMNACKVREERQAITAQLLENEIDLIDRRGFNPITGAYMAPVREEAHAEIRSDTPFLEALYLALDLVEADPDTKADIRSILKYFAMSAQKLRKEAIPVKEIRRGDIILILENCKNLVIDKKGKGGLVKKQRKIWTANQFNHYRKYLSILYSQLDVMEIVDYNPIEKIPLKEDPSDQEKAPRVTLSDEEAGKVNAILLAKDPLFHRFIHIFFHSGARRKELMRLQGKVVDLRRQRFKVLVKKRKKKAWVWKTIKDIALPFWQQAMEGCGPEDFLFSVGLKPGPKAIRPEQVTRRWARHVKPLGIKADFYSLKHKNSTDTTTAMMAFMKRKEAAQLLAAEQNSHTSGAMVVGIYDTQEATRVHEELKGVNNTFGRTSLL